MLGSDDLIAFVATALPEQAKEFYAEVLGLRLVGEEPTALVFDAHGIMLRVSIVPEFAPPLYSVLGWKVDDIEAKVGELAGNGVHFERYEVFDQDQLGIHTFPNGDKVAWFRDPDGNTLSLTQPG